MRNGFSLGFSLGIQNSDISNQGYEYSAVWDFVSNLYLGGSPLTYTGSGGTYFDSTGILQDATSNQMRFDHDPVTLAPRGILIEGARTNAIRNPRCEGASAGSPGITPTHWNGNWSGTGLTREIVGRTTVNGMECIDIRVYGTASAAVANILYFDDTSGVLAAATGQAVTASCFAQMLSFIGPSDVTVTLVLREDNGGSFLRQSMVDLKSAATLTRIANTVTCGASTTGAAAGARIGAASGASFDFTIRIGLPQLELGAFASSPIRPPVSSPASVTRATDLLTTAVGGWFNPSEGTWVVASSRPYADATDTFPRVLQIDDGTNNNRLVIGWATLSSNLRAESIVSGTNQCLLGESASQTSASTIAFSYKANDFAASVNGGAAATDTSGSVPTGLTTVRFGSRVNDLQLFGHIRRVSCIPRRVSNAELQVLST